MADTFQITPPTIQAAGTDVPPEQIQAGFNSVCRQVQNALNTVSSDPTGPAGGDLGGTYPNPTVVKLHVTSGTESGVTITGDTIDSSPIGQTTPAAGAFTTLTATTPVAIASGGTGSGTAAGARTNLGLGTIATQNANNVAITGGTIDNTPIGQTTTAAGSFTTLNSTGGALNGTVGATTPNTGSFTTLNSTGGALNGSIGATAPSTGSFTTVAASSPITVPNGGTGLATLTSHALLSGNGTSAVAQIGAGTTGQMLLGVTGNFPAFGNNPTITGGTIDGAVIGGTTPAAGSFTTITASSTITPSQTSGIVGTTTNNNANAGSVGEFVTNTTLTTSASSGTPLNATSVSLTAGDWDVTGTVQTVPAGTTTQSAHLVGVSTTSATFSTISGTFLNFNQIVPISAAGTQSNLTAPVTRISIASTTTVFLVTQINFAVSTLTVDGFIRARRVR